MSIFVPVAVVGHRGNGSGVNENTPESFGQAILAGATWIETDLRLTLDGHLVLAHDGRALAESVHNITLAQALDNGFQPATVIDNLPVHVGMNLEVKASFGDLRSGVNAADIVATFIAERKGMRSWLMSSFDPFMASAARTKKVPFGLLTHGWMHLDEAIVLAVQCGAQVACVHENAWARKSYGRTPGQQECLQQATEHSMQLMVWGASLDTARGSQQSGIAAVCVDNVIDTANVIKQNTRALSVR